MPSKGTPTRRHFIERDDGGQGTPAGGRAGISVTDSPTVQRTTWLQEHRRETAQAFHSRAGPLQSQDPTDLPIFFCGYNLLEKSPAGNVSVSFCLLFFDSP